MLFSRGDRHPSALEACRPAPAAEATPARQNSATFRSSRSTRNQCGLLPWTRFARWYPRGFSLIVGLSVTGSSTPAPSASALGKWAPGLFAAHIGSVLGFGAGPRLPRAHFPTPKGPPRKARESSRDSVSPMGGLFAHVTVTIPLGRSVNFAASLGLGIKCAVSFGGRAGVRPQRFVRHGCSPMLGWSRGVAGSPLCPACASVCRISASRGSRWRGNQRIGRPPLSAFACIQPGDDGSARGTQRPGGGRPGASADEAGSSSGWRSSRAGRHARDSGSRSFTPSTLLFVFFPLPKAPRSPGCPAIDFCCAW